MKKFFTIPFRVTKITKAFYLESVVLYGMSSKLLRTRYGDSILISVMMLCFPHNLVLIMHPLNYVSECIFIVHTEKDSDIIIGSFSRPSHCTDSVLGDILSSIVTTKEKFPHVPYLKVTFK